MLFASSFPNPTLPISLPAEALPANRRGEVSCGFCSWGSSPRPLCPGNLGARLGWSPLQKLEARPLLGLLGRTCCPLSVTSVKNNTFFHVPDVERAWAACFSLRTTRPGVGQPQAFTLMSPTFTAVHTLPRPACTGPLARAPVGQHVADAGWPQATDVYWPSSKCRALYQAGDGHSGEQDLPPRDLAERMNPATRKVLRREWGSEEGVSRARREGSVGAGHTQARRGKESSPLLQKVPGAGPEDTHRATSRHQGLSPAPPAARSAGTPQGHLRGAGHAQRQGPCFSLQCLPRPGDLSQILLQGTIFKAL